MRSFTQFQPWKKNGSTNDIPRTFLRDCLPYLSIHLCELFNMSISESIFPDSFKLAYVTPVHKKGPKDDVRNYRPISIISNLSKVFETLIHNRLSKFFYGKQLLSENQFGFRRGKSTELACLSLVDRVLPAFADKGYAICVFLDFSACFDTVDREMIIAKLDRYGISNWPLELVKSYFTIDKGIG